MNNNTASTGCGSIPFQAKRILAKYEPAIRAKLTAALQEKLSSNPSLPWDEICSILGDVLFGEAEDRRRNETSQKDRDEKAIDDYRAGRCMTTKEMLASWR